jgi:hypothetical protein
VRDSTRAFLAIGTGLGILAGAWDGLALRLENPRSFEAESAATFVAASIALHGAFGFAAGAASTLVARLVPALRPASALALGLGGWVFAWSGVRVHVRWFFGEPILARGSLLANLALLAASLAIAWLIRRQARAVAAGAERSRVLVVETVAVGVAAVLATAPGSPRDRAGARAAPASGARDMLLVTLDTTRMDHLSAFGYPRGTTPAIDRVARRGACDVLWVTVPLTNPSHCSLLTGLPPRAHGVLNNGTALSDTIPTIVDALAAKGWTCGAFVSGIPLKADLSGLDRSFGTYDDSFSALERIHPMMTSLAAVRVADRVLPGDMLERRAERTVGAAAAWLARTDSPRFLWVHVFDPHTPYRAPRAVRARFGRESDGWTANQRAVTEWPVADYDAELRATDRALATLFREFETVASSGIIAIVADHGEGLLQHGELTHGALLHEEDLAVAWVVSGAGPGDSSSAARLRGAAPPRPATDVAAILAAFAAGRSAPSSDEGIVRADTFPPEGRGRKTAMIGRLPGSGIGKTIVDWERGERVAFRIDADPGELRPIEPVGSEWAALLPEDAESAAGDGLDPDVERRLRALGYVH